MRHGALSQTAFRLLLVGQAISALGDRLVPVALAFAVLELTGSVTDLGIVLAAQTGPLVVFVLLGGVWADRLPRQAVMLACDGVRAVAQALSAALLLGGDAHVWQLAVLQAVYGTAEAFFAPASTAVVPQTVDPANLQQANALLGLSGNLASVLGPALAGVIVATLGPGWGLGIDAASFITSAVFLSFMRPKSILTTPRAGILAAALTNGASLTLFNAFWLTALQREIPLAELSRVSSWDYVGSLAFQPLGFAASGPVAAAIGLSTTMYAAAGVFLLLTVVALAVPSLRNFASSPRAPLVVAMDA